MRHLKSTIVKRFGLVQFDDTGSNVWTAPTIRASSPVSIKFGSTTYDANTAFELVNHYVDYPDLTTLRQVVVLRI